jgi:hypothetical protein
VSATGELSTRPIGARWAFGGKWARSLVGGLLVWFCARVTVSSIAVVSHAIAPGRDAFFDRPTWFVSLFFHWDSKYFAAIATSGYFRSGSSQSLQAFLPGYPLAVRFIAGFASSSPIANQIAVAMFLVAFVSSAAASVVLWRLVDADHGPPIAAAAVVLFAFGPYSIFLQASYSEPLFLAFAIGAWWAVRTDRWVLGGVLAAIASLTRINGVFLVLALGVLFVAQRRRGGHSYLGPVSGLVALGLSGITAYLAYLWASTGNVFAWFDAQSVGWHRTLNWPWVTFANTADEALHGKTFDHRLQSTLDIAFALLAVLAVVVLVMGRHWASAVFVAITIGSLMTSNTYLSLARNTLVLFPLVILVASALDKPRWRWVYWAWLASSLIILIINVHEFTLGGWTG